MEMFGVKIHQILIYLKHLTLSPKSEKKRSKGFRVENQSIFFFTYLENLTMAKIQKTAMGTPCCLFKKNGLKNQCFQYIWGIWLWPKISKNGKGYPLRFYENVWVQKSVNLWYIWKIWLYGQKLEKKARGTLNHFMKMFESKNQFPIYMYIGKIKLWPKLEKAARGTPSHLFKKWLGQKIDQFSCIWKIWLWPKIEKAARGTPCHL